ncbi:hypothetical protein [Clostridium sp. UBA5119]|uniref:hypothetical protein n=1 Tax=Clostridium sp. UBA5119 TaxID=1946366 RepID=UPI0032171C80
MLKIELKRAFKRKTFLFALLVGIMFCVLDNIEANYYNIISSYSGYNNYFNEFLKSSVLSPYDSFTLFNLTSLSNIFIMLIPILSAISYSDSYLEDVNSGFLKNVLSRCSKRKYLQSKFLANFIISGITISIPLLIELLLLLATQPNIKPERLYNAIHIGSLNLDMYLNQPLLYTLIWIFISFMFAGVISSISLGFSIVIRNKFVVLIAPFISVMVIHLLFDMIGLFNYSVLDFLYLASMAISSKPTEMLITFIVMLIVTYLPFYFGGKSNEAF